MENKRQGKIEKRDRETNFLSVLPKEVHRHFYRMLLAFENVLLRYCHLAQIVRQKMVSYEKNVLSNFAQDVTSNL